MVDKQEPIAWMVYTLDGTAAFVTLNPADFTGEHRALPLYTTPQPKREWVGLTKDEFDLLVPYCHNEFDLNDYKKFSSAIEAKLKEKNGG